MVRSTTDRNKGTAPPKPIRKIWTIGSISADDKGFLEWRKDQSLMSHGCTVLEGMVHYVNQLNFESEERYEREMKEYKALPLSAANNDTCSDPDQTAEPAKLKALDDTSNTNMNIPTPQIISPLSQNISEPQLQEQSTTLIPEHSSQEHSRLIPEHSSRNIPILPPQPSVPTTVPRTEQSLDANNLTMSQALELFELLQSRRAAEVVRPLTIEAQQVEVAPRRAEPLSFMTLQTVEGIIESSDLDADQGQNSWEAKMNKFVGLGHAYSSVNTVSGETCYMIDGQLYQNILLAVAARKQNERSLTTVVEKLEQHMEQITSSNERVIQGERDALERMARRMDESFIEFRGDHQARMMNVMSDIRSLNASITSSAEHGTDSDEMLRLKVQVERYDQIFPICQAQVKDLEQLNKKLRSDLLGERHRNELMKIRLDRAEALAIRLGTPKTNKRSRTDEREHESDESDHGSSSSSGGEDEDDGEDEDEQEQSEHFSSSSEDEQGGAKEQPGTDEVMEISDDSNAPDADPGKNDEDKKTAPVSRTSYREALKTPKEQHARDGTTTTSSGTGAAPATTKLITLSSRKKGDSDNKRTRSAAEQSSDQEQPSNKRPLSEMSTVINTAQNMMLAARELPTAEARTNAARSAVQHVTSASSARNQEKEEAIQEEVRRSAQNVRWVKGPLPVNIDHWFYDLRNAGTEPPPSLVSASRNMVLKWKAALGPHYFPLTRNAGASVLRLEHAHRSFVAVTADMPISGWTSRACAKHQILHGMVKIPKLVARDGDPLSTRPCPLIYYYEQLLEDMRHIITHNFEPIHRTILNPIPKSSTTSSPSLRNSKTIPPNSSSSSTPDRRAWRQVKSARGKKNMPSADEHFQELAKDIHESNKNISNPYEHEDTEQFNSAFDSLLSDEKKEQVARAKKLIRLIKSGDPPKNYVERRKNKLQEDPRDDNMGSSTTSVYGFYGTTIKEYDEYAIFDLEQFIENISTDNADMHILGYYEDRIGAYPNINSRNGPSGQGSR